MIFFPLLTALLFTLPPGIVNATWSTTVHDNLEVTPGPGGGCWPITLPYTNGGTLVVFRYDGACYQFINRYGILAFSEPQSLAPETISLFYTSYQ